MSRKFLLPFAAALVLAGQAHAAGRSFSVTGFDKLRVEGPYTVDVRTGAGSSARASGDLRALDRLSVTVQGRTLIVRPDRSGWTGWPGERPGGEVTLSISTPSLSSAALNGSGSVSIDRMAGSRIDLWVSGSGNASVAEIEADRLDLSLSGSGKVVLAGKAAQARVTVLGAGNVDAHGLTVADADVTMAGAGDVTLSATRRATVKAEGAGNVTIGGSPACAVAGRGQGVVRCGK
ncbi:hypothetical protein BSL82_16320 [Tardibacter chloracetimidivorans]|uniref:Putative auto-transporter adhesin head GIN domain-containing protein n=1 Tax=Tardibacter chloracetimidivorans TaxID=1921510 RepID=A0A1L3ZYG4_9SPHN|nr:head GIN domain-containing protein [Tardibacter chloracetimidivorans]API60662.1 hypothetical protein BSL82_16320 [Tardibacter chloracetimidivorans]